MILPLMQTAELNGADSYYYMKFLCEELPQHMYQNPTEYMADMMPWSGRYRAYDLAERQKVLDGFKPPDGNEKPPPRKRRKRAEKVA